MFDSIITFEYDSTMFLATVGSSAFSAVLAFTKFLLLGPCRLVPDEGYLGGHGRLGFLLLFLNVATTSFSKALMLFAIASKFKHAFKAMFIHKVPWRKCKCYF